MRGITSEGDSVHYMRGTGAWCGFIMKETLCQSKPNRNYIFLLDEADTRQVDCEKCLRMAKDRGIA